MLIGENVDWRHTNRLDTKIVFSNQLNVIGNNPPDFETIDLDWKHIPYGNVWHLFVETKVKIKLQVSNLNDSFQLTHSVFNPLFTVSKLGFLFRI